MSEFKAEYHARLAGPWSDIQDQLPLLYGRACRYPGVKVAEFGVRTGESTAAFLAAAEAVGGHVWSYDVDEPSVPSWWVSSGRWTFTRASSLAATPPPCQVLFIDTSHAYADTVAELCRLVPLVQPGGVVLCHDTKLTHAPFEPLAVARALDDYCAETGREWSELGGMLGLGEILIYMKAVRCC